MRSIAPRSVFSPVPGSHAEFGIVPVSNRSPARGESFLNNVWRIDLINVVVRENIDGAAQGAVGIEGIDCMRRGSINMNGCGLHLARVPLQLGRRARALPDPQRQGESKEPTKARFPAVFAYHSFSDLDEQSRHVPPFL